MKTETQIAQENIEDVRRVLKQLLSTSELHYKGLCFFHKASCQRFLEFLTDTMIINIDMCPKDNEEYIKNKITDLKQAIKLYEDDGI